MQIRKSFKYILAPVIVVFIPLVLFLYFSVFGSNIKTLEKGSVELYIPEGINIQNIVSYSSYLEPIIKKKQTLLFTAKLKRYSGRIRPGMYIIKENMSNNELVNIFRSGMQKPVVVTFNNIRTKQELSGNLAKQIMVDSTELLLVLNNAEFLKSQGFDLATAVCPFLPDSYEMYWSINAKDLYIKMVSEYQTFWSDKRLAKAKVLNLSPNQIITLASIVNEESNFADEQPVIAGLYINRLKRGYLLQADPTLKFALNDFEKKRVLNVDKEIDSPYNTYKFKGLPPGPIRIPTKAAIDAVLNYKDHNYLYMCASADFSGKHHFSETFKEHKRYAREYQRKLNKLRIYN